MEWYIIYTRPHCEKQVARALARKNIIYYSPVKKVVTFSGQKDKPFEEPLLPRYIFVSSEQSRHKELLQIPGIINFAFWMDRPAVIREEEIVLLRQFLIDHTNVSLSKMTRAFNQAEEYDEIAAEEFPGTYNSSEKVSVALPTFGYIISSETRKSGSQLIPVGTLTGSGALHGTYLNTA